MRGKLIWCGLVLAAGATGCSPLANVARTTLAEPAEYCQSIDCAVSGCRSEKLADMAWNSYTECHADVTLSRDFALGFKEGYADYVFAGGKGNPPPLPPRWYWRPENQSPEGQRAIRDWYAGFRVGAAQAKRDGFRDLAVIPSSTSLLVAQPGRTIPAVPPLHPAPAAEILPPPVPAPSPPPRMPPAAELPVVPEPMGKVPGTGLADRP